MSKFQKKSVLAVLVLTLLAVSLGAMDSMWGANLKLNLELPEIYGSTAAVSSGNNARAWYRGSWGPQANVEADLGVGFRFSLLFGVNNNLKPSWNGFSYNVYPMLDKLNFYGRKGMVEYRAGRYPLRDPGGIIVSSPVDGINAIFNVGAQRFRVGAGYTGLTFLQSSRYYLTLMDSADRILSPGRIMEYASWEMSGVTEWLDVSASLIAVQDLSLASERQKRGCEAFHPIYLGLYAKGFVGKSFLYDAAFAGQLGFYSNAQNAMVLAGIGRVKLAWLPGSSSRLGLDVQFASGDTDARRSTYLMGSTSGKMLNQYLALSAVSSRGYVVNFKSGNLTSIGLQYSRKPSDSFSWEVRTTTFLRNAEGPVSVLLVAPGTNGLFLGQEALLSCMWRPRSDFGWDLRVGLLYTGKPIQLDTFLQQHYLDKVPLMGRLGFNWTWSF